MVEFHCDACLSYQRCSNIVSHAPYQNFGSSIKNQWMYIFDVTRIQFSDRYYLSILEKMIFKPLNFVPINVLREFLSFKN